MRILHTSDWHLGQNFYSKSRAAEHDAFLTWLLDRDVYKRQVFTGIDLVDQAGRPIVELRQTGIAQPVVRLPLL